MHLYHRLAAWYYRQLYRITSAVLPVVRKLYTGLLMRQFITNRLETVHTEKATPWPPLDDLD